jgi:uncharacterized membrane protein
MTALKWGAACILLISASAATAQDFPAAFAVSGVAGDDVLNIRAEPNTTSAIIGSILPYATSIEVLELSANGNWGLVSTGEGNGWAAMRFLEPMPAPDENSLPRPLSCLGTEPFWSVGLLPRGDEFSTPGYRADLIRLSEAAAPQGYIARLQVAKELPDEEPTETMTLTITRATCSDGMSDRRYGFTAVLFTESDEGNSLRSGCCTLDMR